MRTSHVLKSALVLALVLVALPALADAPAAELDFDTLQGAQATAEDCNQRKCGGNQFCCNYSCSICAPIGGFCTQQVCDPVEVSLEEELGLESEPTAAEAASHEAEPVRLDLAPAPAEPAVTTPQPEATGGGILPGGGQCNQAVCGADQFCCNWSCSTCAPRGGACLDVYCPPIS